jgi:hypothetical protein
MDDHHHQPVWPMIQGAANYAWNLIEEAWGMIWKPADESRERAVRDAIAIPGRAEPAMREFDGTQQLATGTTESATVREDLCAG